MKQTRTGADGIFADERGKVPDRVVQAAVALSSEQTIQQTLDRSIQTLILAYAERYPTASIGVIARDAAIIACEKLGIPDGPDRRPRAGMSVRFNALIRDYLKRTSIQSSKKKP